MFGVVVAGRLPQTASLTPDATHLVFHLPEAFSINHLVVFMDGSQPFPPGYAATVHFLMPAGGSVGSGSSWRLLGGLGNEKPSAVFRVKGLGNPPPGSAGSTGQVGGSGMFTDQNMVNNPAFAATTQEQSSVASLGISVESVESVEAQVAALKKGGAAGGEADANANSSGNAGALVRQGQVSRTVDLEMALMLAPKIAQNIFSYLSSFAPDAASGTIPILQKWLEQFQRKLRTQGADFLNRTSD